MHVFAFNRNQKRSESKPDNASRVRRMGNGSQGNEGESVRGATATDMLDDDFVYLL